MAAMTRKQAREIVFELLFESEFSAERTPAETLALACEQREIGEDEYIRTTYLGAMEHRAVLDVLLGRFSKGWKTDRMSRVSRAVLRLCTYEMLYCGDIPASVSLNEAVELAKKFDDTRARAFVNGVLNSIKDEIEGKGASAVIATCEAGVAVANEPNSDDE